MLGRLAIRNLEAGMLEALASMATRHERSTEAEARFAIRHWIDQHAAQATRLRQRRGQVADRLNWLLNQCNSLLNGFSTKPSHIAQAIGESHGEPAEQWFAGELEPSFAQLEAIAEFLGANATWLQHGDRSPFVVTEARIPSAHDEAIAWLLTPPPPNNRMHRIKAIHFIRADNTDGNLAIVQEFENKRCRTFTTPYHISDQTGDGGRSDLADISNIFSLLYAIYIRNSKCPPVNSYISAVRDYDSLTSGKTHPLSAIRDNAKALWWEDWWDPKMFTDNSRANCYWPGWQALAKRIYALVEDKNWRKETRTSIIAGTHPVLSFPLPDRD